MATAVSVRDVSRHFRLYHERTLAEGAGDQLRQVPLRGLLGAARHQPRDRRRATVGLLGAQRLGQVDPAQVHRGDPAADDGRDPSAGPDRRAARARRRLPAGPDRSREHLPERLDPRAVAARDRPKRFDEIVAFSELEQFIDKQVKHYSSGMYVRLGFADRGQRRAGHPARRRGARGRRRGVPAQVPRAHHASSSARAARSCSSPTRRTWSARSATGPRCSTTASSCVDGTPGEAVRAFREHLFSGDALAVETTTTEHRGTSARSMRCASAPSEMEQRRNLKVRITAVVRAPGSGRADASICCPSRLVIHVSTTPRIARRRDVRDRDLRRQGVNLFGANTKIHGARGPRHARVEIRFSFADVPLLDGTYPVTLAIQTHDEGVVYDWHEQQWQFEVMNPDRPAGIVAMPLEVCIVDRSHGSDRRREGRGRGRSSEQPTPRSTSTVWVTARDRRRRCGPRRVDIVPAGFERELDAVFGRLRRPGGGGLRDRNRRGRGGRRHRPRDSHRVGEAGGAGDEAAASARWCSSPGTTRPRGSPLFATRGRRARCGCSAVASRSSRT